MGRLTGKVALITGGSRGLGAAIVRRFVDEGAKVALTDVRVDDGAQLAATVGDHAMFLRHDVRDGEDWARVVSEVESAFGPISVLVNNAGVFAVGNATGPIEEMDEAAYRETIDVNQVGVFLGMKHVIASMRRAGGGSIVNMSSAAGLTGVGGRLAYVASKWAVTGMTETAAIELGPDRIRVNSVHPGTVWTPIHDIGSSPAEVQRTHDRIEAMAANLPLGRVGEPAEVANLVLYLSSDESSYSTGSHFVVDGGYLLRSTTPRAAGPG